VVHDRAGGGHQGAVEAAELDGRSGMCALMLVSMFRLRVVAVLDIQSRRRAGL
jgi:hypothetical protein